MAIRAAELSVLISADTAKFESGMKSVSDTLRKISGGSSGLGDVFGGVLGANILQNVVAQVTQLGSTALQSYADYERLGMSLQSLTAKELLQTGAAQSMTQAMSKAGPQAQELLKWTQKLAIESPFTQAGVSSAFRMAQAYGFNTEQAKRLTQALIDFAAGSGQGEESMQRIALALGQIQAKGKLSGQEILQLTEAGLNVNSILAKAFGVTTGEIASMTEKGLIPANEAIEAIATSLEEDFGGAAKRQAGSFSGLLSTLEDIKDIGLREFFSGFFKDVQPELQEFVDTLQDPKTIEQIQKMGEEFAGTAMDIVSGVKDVVTWYGNLDKSTKDLALTMGGLLLFRKPIAGMLADMVDGGRAVVGAVKGIAAGISAYKAGMSLTTALGAAGLGPIAITLGAIGLAVGSVAAVWAQWNSQITQTNENGKEAARGAWADFFEKLEKKGASAAEITDEFTAAMKRLDDQMDQAGALAIFIDQTGLQKDALKAFSDQVYKSSKSYSEYKTAIDRTYNSANQMIDAQGNLCNIVYEYDAATGQLVGVLNQVVVEHYAVTEAEWNTAQAASAVNLAMGAMSGFVREANSSLNELWAAKTEAKNLADSFTSAIDQINNRFATLNTGTGNDLVNLLKQRLPESSALYKGALGEIDSVMGTSFVKQQEYNDNLTKIINNYAWTGDKASLRTELEKLKEINLQTAKQELEDVVKQAEGLYQRLMDLPETMRIDIGITETISTYYKTFRESETKPRPGTTVEARASGGSVWAGRPYLVGEEAPEIFVPDQNGRIYTADQYARKSTSPTEKTEVHIDNVNIYNEWTYQQFLSRLKQDLARVR